MRVNLRNGSPKQGQLRFRSRHEAISAPYFVDTRKFADTNTKWQERDIRFQGLLTFCPIYRRYYVSSPESPCQSGCFDSVLRLPEQSVWDLAATEKPEDLEDPVKTRSCAMRKSLLAVFALIEAVVFGHSPDVAISSSMAAEAMEGRHGQSGHLHEARGVADRESVDIPSNSNSRRLSGKSHVASELEFFFLFLMGHVLP